MDFHFQPPLDFTQFFRNHWGVVQARNYAEIPELPGIYFWFPPIDPNQNGIYDLLKRYKLQQDRIAAFYQQTLANSSGTIEAHIEHRHIAYELSDEDVARLSLVTEKRLKFVQKLLAASNLLHKCIYIGVARGGGDGSKKGLRFRIWQHLQHRTLTPNAQHIRRPVSFNMDNCLVAYVTFTGFSEQEDEQGAIAEILEPLLIATFRPIFNYKIGR